MLLQQIIGKKGFYYNMKQATHSKREEISETRVAKWCFSHNKSYAIIWRHQPAGGGGLYCSKRVFLEQRW